MLFSTTNSIYLKKNNTILQQNVSTGFHIFMADCPEMSKLKTSFSKIIYMWEYLGFPNRAKTINILSNPQTHNRSMFACVQFVIPHLEIVVLSCDFFHFCICCICGLLPHNLRPSELFASMGLEKTSQSLLFPVFLLICDTFSPSFQCCVQIKKRN